MTTFMEMYGNRKSIYWTSIGEGTVSTKCHKQKQLKIQIKHDVQIFLGENSYLLKFLYYHDITYRFQEKNPKKQETRKINS